MLHNKEHTIHTWILKYTVIECISDRLSILRSRTQYWSLIAYNYEQSVFRYWLHRCSGTRSLRKDGVFHFFPWKGCINYVSDTSMRFIVQTSPLFDIISLLFQDYASVWLVSLKYVTLELVSTSHENVPLIEVLRPPRPLLLPVNCKVRVVFSSSYASVNISIIKR